MVPICPTRECLEIKFLIFPQHNSIHPCMCVCVCPRLPMMSLKAISVGPAGLVRVLLMDRKHPQGKLTLLQLHLLSSPHFSSHTLCTTAQRFATRRVYVCVCLQILAEVYPCMVACVYVCSL